MADDVLSITTRVDVSPVTDGMGEISSDVKSAAEQIQLSFTQAQATFQQLDAHGLGPLFAVPPNYVFFRALKRNDIFQ